MIVLPVLGLFAITIGAAIAAPALLGSFGFRANAFAFKPEKLSPLAGLKRMFSVHGLIELGKSMAKVVLLGAIGFWLLFRESRNIAGLAAPDIGPALSSVGTTFVTALLIMAVALAAIAMVDVPAQIFQRGGRLRMSKQEVKEEHKQTEGSPELKAAVRRRQHEVLRNSARSAVAEANGRPRPTRPIRGRPAHRPDEDAAPIVVARGRGATAEAIRSLAGESKVPILSYPQLARAIYFTTRTGHIIREDLYLAVATVLAFVFSLDATTAAARAGPAVTVPPGARFDEKGRPETKPAAALPFSLLHKGRDDEEGQRARPQPPGSRRDGAYRGRIAGGAQHRRRRAPAGRPLCPGGAGRPARRADRSLARCHRRRDPVELRLPRARGHGRRHCRPPSRGSRRGCSRRMAGSTAPRCRNLVRRS